MDLRSQGKISRLGKYPRSRWEFSQKNGEQERRTRGNQSFQKLIQFLYFGVCLYTHRDEYSHAGVSSSDLYQNQVLHIKVYIKVLGVLHHLLAIRPADIL